MDSAQECVLGVRRVRRFFKYAGFGFVLLWILFGSYGPDRANHELLKRQNDSASMRKLLAINFSTNADLDTFEVTVL